MPDKEAAPARRLPEPGDVVARKYRIDRRLGMGGMGAVYLAHHELLHQPVAIKFLLPELAREPSIVGRFLNEARASAQIRDEHAIVIHDVDKLEDGNAYMVLEYLEGTDLATLLTNQGPLPPAEAVGFTLQALQAVARAHALGIVHRDLKPANLFLATRPDGSSVVKVLDFGISKMSATDPHAAELSRTGATLGTLRYMPPEQIRDAKTVDERADIWAIGVILHLLLTGKPPFEGGETEVIAAILEQTPPPVSALRPGLLPKLDEIVGRCLRKNRDDRYRDVGELAADLATVIPETGPQFVDQIRRILAGRTFTRAGYPETAVERVRLPPPVALSPESPESDATIPPPPLLPPQTPSSPPAGPRRTTKIVIGIAGLFGIVAVGLLSFFTHRTTTNANSVSYDWNPISMIVGDTSGDAGAEQPPLTGKKRFVRLSGVATSACTIDQKWLETKLASMREDDAIARGAADDLYLEDASVDACLLGIRDGARAPLPGPQAAMRTALFNYVWQIDSCQLLLQSNTMSEFAALRDYFKEPSNNELDASAGGEILAAANRYLMYYLFAFVSHSEGATRYREELEQFPGMRAQLKQPRLHDHLDSDTILAAALYMRRWNPSHPEAGKASRQEKIPLWRAPPNAETREKAGLAVGSLKSFLVTGKAASSQQFLQLWEADKQDDAFFKRMMKDIWTDHRFLFKSVTDALVAGPAVRDKESGAEVELLLKAAQDYYAETGKAGGQADRTRLADTWGHPFLSAMDSVHRGMGKLVIDSTPSAAVVVDDVDSGRSTPVTALDSLELPAGEHNVVLRADDGRTATRALKVEAAEFVKIPNVEDFK